MTEKSYQEHVEKMEEGAWPNDYRFVLTQIIQKK
jgi:hypothetical protein